MHSRITYAALILLFCATGLVLATPAHAQNTNLTIYNESLWTIRIVRLSSTEDENWGPDRLGQHVLRTGYQFTVSGLICDRYDAQIIDEDGDVCILRNIRVCGRNTEWHFTNESLLLCESDSEGG
jgi:hypothetical protein